MRRMILSFGFLLMATTAANAGFTSMGVGTVTCERFQAQYIKDPTLAETVFFSWAQGFMSGVNEMLILRGARTKDLQSISLEDQKMQLRAYCRANPTHVYKQAVIKLIGALGTNAAATAAPRKGQ